jgi:transposase
MSNDAATPQDLNELRELVALLRQENSLLRNQNSNLTQQVSLLLQKVDSLVRRVFGASSERIDPSQLELLHLANSSAPLPSPPPSPIEPRSFQTPRERQPKAPRIPENLPVVEEVIEPEEVASSPADWRCIGQEVSEQLDYEQARFFRRRLIRRKYVRVADPDQAPIVAPLPEKLLERGLAGAGLLAQVVVSKYCDHLPLYRQEQIFAQRHHINIPRQTLARWVELVADWLQPVYATIRTGVLSGGYVQVDETPVEYLSPGHGQTKQGYLWAANQPKGDVFFGWQTSRAADCLEELLGKGFGGILQCDGYSAYPAFAKGKEALELSGCWAHVRRKFHEALAQSPGRAGWVLRQIQHLYRIEALLREAKAGPELREALRAGQSRLIVERLRRVMLLFQASRQHLPQSLLGQAVEYALGQWKSLEVYLRDGRVEIDNNLVENAIRPTALGKKNWLFVGEAGAGQCGAILYSIIESCRRRKIDPYTYLKDVLTRLPRMTNKQVPELAPAAWVKARATTRKKPTS